MRTTNQPLNTHIHTKSLKCIHLLFTFFGLAWFNYCCFVTVTFNKFLTISCTWRPTLLEKEVGTTLGLWYICIYVSGNLSTLTVSVRVLVYIFVRNVCPSTDNYIHVHVSVTLKSIFALSFYSLNDACLAEKQHMLISYWLWFEQTWKNTQTLKLAPEANILTITQDILINNINKKSLMVPKG